MQARGTSISPRVLHKHLLLHRRVREARVRVKVEDKAHMQGLQGPKGVSMPSYHRLSQGSVGLTRYVSTISPMGEDII